MELKVHCHPWGIELHLFGDAVINDRNFIRHLDYTVAVCRQHNTQNVLIYPEPGARVQFNRSISGSVEGAAYLMSAGMSGARIAVVRAVDESDLVSQALMDAASNRGITIGYFSHRDTAIEWLSCRDQSDTTQR